MRIKTQVLIPVTAVLAMWGLLVAGVQDSLEAQTSQRDLPASEAAGLAVIQGTVIAADTGRPLRRALVRISGGGLREPVAVATDEDGRYRMTRLAAGRYTMSASKAGYLTLSFGQRRAREAGRPVEVMANRTMSNVDFALPPGGVITVRVSDEFGEPVPDVTVQVQQMAYLDGVPTFVTPGNQTLPMLTSDQGEVRVSGLPPGDYYVSANLRTRVVFDSSDNKTSYTPTYYPGTPSISEAQRVSLSIGHELSLDFPLATARASTIAGYITRADGDRHANPAVALTQYVGGVATTTSTRGVSVQSNGAFSIVGVVPGDYLINVSGGPGASPREYAFVPMTVTGTDVSGLSITTMRYGKALGRLMFESEIPTSLKPGAIRMNALSTERHVASTADWRWNEDWTFEVEGLAGHRVIRMVDGSSGWYLKSVMMDDQDITDIPIDFDRYKDVDGIHVTLTREVTDFVGTVVDNRRVPVLDYAVVVFSEDRSKWSSWSRYIGHARPDQNGLFRIRALPPGQYRAVAVDYLESGSERAPEFLARLSNMSDRVVLTQGQPVNTVLTLRNVP